MRKLCNKNLSAGFTLVELMIVVVIVGVLTSLAISRYSEAVDKAKYSSARLWLKKIFLSCEEFYNQHGCYPADVNPNIAPPGLCPTFLEYWPNPTQDPFNSLYDYENHPFDGMRAVGITYLGKDLRHELGWQWGWENATVGEIIEIDGGDDLFIVIAKKVKTCTSTSTSTW
ncbi:hypothetical protein DRQ36_05845 [bacterium]|nr:MAG: hypothetical protein DRQ36_05845 [bacterium]